MRQAYLIPQGLDEFAAAREQFGQLIEALGSEQNLALEHGDVEELIWQDGKELLRRLLQGHLDLRSAREPKRAHVTGADGVIRTPCRSGCTRPLMSLFGEVTITRRGYGARGQKSVFPLDAQLNLARDKYSHGLRRRVGEEAIKGSFDELAAGLPIATGVIEGACRHLVKDRMDITGACWRLQRAEALLKLRSIKSSGDSVAYWEFYKEQTLSEIMPHSTSDFPLQEAA